MLGMSQLLQDVSNLESITSAQINEAKSGWDSLSYDW